jgi:hypothetical protein
MCHNLSSPSNVSGSTPGEAFPSRERCTRNLSMKASVSREVYSNHKLSELSLFPPPNQPPPTSNIINPGSFLHHHLPVCNSSTSSLPPLLRPPLSSPPPTLLHPFAPKASYHPTLTPTPYRYSPPPPRLPTHHKKGKYTSHSLSHHLFRFPHS